MQTALRSAFPVDARRLVVFTALALAVIQAHTVVLYSLNTHVALPGSLTARDQRLTRFVQFSFPEELFPRFALSFLPEGPVDLILDRTNWRLGLVTLPLFSVPVGLRISQHTGGHMKGKRYTEQQILDILGQLDAGTPISDLTRLHGVASATIYRWKAKYGGMTKEETRKFRQLEVENQRLKKLVADLSLDNVMLKEVVGRKW